MLGPIARRNLADALAGPAESGLGVTRQGLGALLDVEQRTDRAQRLRRGGEPAADQRVRNMRLLLHPIGERHIGGADVANIEHQIGLQPHHIFEIDRVAATGQPADFGELGVSRRQKRPRLRAGRPVQPSIFSAATA